MNWLAHLYLSEPEVEFRVGNLLPDWVGPWEMVGLPEGFRRGLRGTGGLMRLQMHTRW